MNAAGIFKRWFGPGGHPDCGEHDLVAVGAHHDYRATPRNGKFAAQRREFGGLWTDISVGHDLPYDACNACGKSEMGVAQVQPAVVEPVPAAPVQERKLSAVERLALARRK